MRGLLCLALCVACLGATAAHGDHHRLTVTVDVTSARSGPLPPDFASFSVETPCPKAMMFNNGRDVSEGIRTSYLGLLGWLRDASGTNVGPNIRIGGNSADESWFAPDGKTPTPPPGLHVLTDDDVAAFTHYASADASITPDLSLRNPHDPNNTVLYAKAVAAAVELRGLHGFEIGNEPELLNRNGIRPTGQPWNYSAWLAQWENHAAALVAAVGAPRIQGAVFCCNTWNRELPGYTRRFSQPPTNWLRTVSHHFYPMAGKALTLENILAHEAVDMYPFRPYAGASVAAGVPFVMGEGNSGFDGGKMGVSNAFASTLWGLDVLFNAAANNFSRWNFHGCTGGAYTPIDTESHRDNATGHTVATARPLFYGMWAFADATQRRARLVAHTRSWDTAAPPNVVAHVTYTDAPSRVVAVVIHKGATAAARPVDVSLALGTACANRTAVVRVGAPASRSLGATSGLAFGGLSFDGSVTGRPLGTPVAATAAVDANGDVASVTVEPVSFVVIEVANCQAK